MNLFKSVFWWMWADDEDRQRVEAKRQEMQLPVEESGHDIEPDEAEYEEFFD